MPKISIITTTYKHQDFIEKTIESILSQSFTDWELLIGDDSPNDTTWDIIQEYTEKYPGKIQAWHHNPNKGIVGNMNFLIEKIHPQSEYIAFLEGDDMYTPDNIEKKLAIFQEYPKVQLVYSDLSCVNEHGEIIKKSLYNHQAKYSCNEPISLGNYVSAGESIFSYSSMMVRKEVLGDVHIRSVGNIPSLVSDYDFVGQVLSLYPVYFLDEALTKYRIHENNISAGSAGLAESMKKLNEFYYKHKLISHDVFNLAIEGNYMAIAAGYFMEGLRWKGLCALIQSIKLSPLKNLRRKVQLIIAIFLPAKMLRKIFYSRYYDKKHA